MDTLKSLTEELLALTEEAERYYIEVVKQDSTYEVDFHHQVKPFADKVQPLAAAWLPIAKAFLVKTNPRDLHVSQLEQTVENLDVVAIKSFYPSSGMKRQRETFKSVRYVLSGLLAEMERVASEQ